MSKEIFNFLSTNPEFVSDIMPDLKCNLCNNVMIKATYLPCGCEYCFKCICNYLDGGNDECPQQCEESDNRKIKLHDVKESQSILKINRLVVKCTNKFCGFQDKVAKVVEHLKTCDKAGLNCPLFPVGCQTRGLTEENLKVHMMENQENHFSKLIEKNGELKTRLNELEGQNVHLDNEIKELKKRITGIEVINKEKENVKQEKAAVKQENSIMKNQSEELKIIIEMKEKFDKENKEMKEKNKELKVENKIIKEKYDKMKLKNEEIKTNNKNIETKFDLMKKENEEIKVKNKELKRENQEIKIKNEEIQASIKNIETKFDLMKKEKENMKEEAGMKNLSPFNWIIEGVAEKKKSSDIWWSLPFYSEEGGYKMEAGIQFQSDGYFYIYGRILRSKNDSKLTWPCTKRLNVKLNNPATRVVHFDGNIQFYGTAATRPKESRNPSKPSGGWEMSPVTNATNNNEINFIAKIL